jgi:hypothetical protein
MLAAGMVVCAALLFYTVKYVSYKVGDSGMSEFGIIKQIHSDSIDRDSNGNLRLKRNDVAITTDSDSSTNKKGVVPCPT